VAAVSAKREAGKSDARAIANLRRQVERWRKRALAAEDRFERCATDAWLIEVEDGAACVAFYRNATVTNGQHSIAECFDDAYAEVWGEGGVMRPEFAQRMREQEARAAARMRPERAPVLAVDPSWSTPHALTPPPLAAPPALSHAPHRPENAMIQRMKRAAKRNAGRARVRDEQRWEAFFASPYFRARIAEAVADMEAGRTLPMPETDEQWDEYLAASPFPEPETNG
jgi:hypothetical protein